MGVDPQKASALFQSDPTDFLVMFFAVIVVVAAFVWWFRGYLVKERIATNEQRMALAREEHTAVTKQIAVLSDQLKLERAQMVQAREEVFKATVAWAEAQIPKKKTELFNATEQIEKALSTSMLATTTVGELSETNKTLGEAISGTRDTPLVLKEWAKSKK